MRKWAVLRFDSLSYPGQLGLEVGSVIQEDLHHVPLQLEHRLHGDRHLLLGKNHHLHVRDRAVDLCIVPPHPNQEKQGERSKHVDQH